MRFAASLFLAAALSGCGDGSISGDFPMSSPDTFTGRLTAAPDTLVGVAWTADHLHAYACDGVVGKISTSEWFTADSPAPTTLDLTSSSGARLTLTRTAAQLTGTFTPKGGPPLDLVAPVESGQAYFSWIPDLSSGWIRLSDGTWRGSNVALPSGCQCNFTFHQVFCKSPSTGQWQVAKQLGSC